jgi:hypothetical protein
MKKKISATLLSLLILISGCASFNPNPTPNISLDKFKYQQTVNGVIVGIDPYFSPIKTKGIFDNDFEEHAMLALFLNTAVPEENTYSITKSDITISDTSSGKTFAPIDWKEAGQCVGRNYGYTVMWFFVGGLIGVIPSAIHTANINSEIENDLATREFQCGPIKSNDAQGFLYYNLEPYKDNFPKDMTANITVQNVKTNEPINFSITFQPEAGWYGEEPTFPANKESPTRIPQNPKGM